MRFWILPVLLLVAGSVQADTCSKSLTGVFTPAQGVKLCQSFGSALNSALIPSADDTYDLGTAALQWQDAWFDGTLSTDALEVDVTDIRATASGVTVALQEATSGSKCMGSVTFNGTTAVTTSTTCATTGSRIFLTPTSDPTGSTAAYCWVTNIVNGTSFDVDCDQANDGTANWIIFHESP